MITRRDSVTLCGAPAPGLAAAPAAQGTAAAARQSVPPVLSLTADGGQRTEGRVGKPVECLASGQVPSKTGVVVAADWDLEGTGSYAMPGPSTPADASRRRVAAKTTCSYAPPGTCFAGPRVALQRDGDASMAYARPLNVARVRVLVT